jgi:hypothetical protein
MSTAARRSRGPFDTSQQMTIDGGVTYQRRSQRAKVKSQRICPEDAGAYCGVEGPRPRVGMRGTLSSVLISAEKLLFFMSGRELCFSSHPQREGPSFGQPADALVGNMRLLAASDCRSG